MSERRFTPTPISWQGDREAYIAGLARLLMDDGGLESVRWLVLGPIFDSLTKEEQDLVFHWCDIWCAQDGTEKHRLDYRP
jgi:hypothetical protein